MCWMRNEAIEIFRTNADSLTFQWLETSLELSRRFKPSGAIWLHRAEPMPIYTYIIYSYIIVDRDRSNAAILASPKAHVEQLVSPTLQLLIVPEASAVRQGNTAVPYRII